MKVDPNILRAERLRAVMAMPEYASTFGAWLEEAKAQASHSLSTAVEVHHVHRAQGGYQMIQSILDQIDKVFQLEDSAVEKQLRKTAKAMEKR
jgi:hypothetical protein